MAKRNLTITLGEKGRYSDLSNPSNHQKVNFFYVYTKEDERYASENAIPQKQGTDSLVELFPHNALAIFNYDDSASRGAPEYGINTLNIVKYSATSIYKREIWYRNGKGGAESIYHPVGINLQDTMIYDHNVGNHRYYEYLFYFGFKNSESSTVSEVDPFRAVMRTDWDGWSITELHPDMEDSTIYYAHPYDVWKFKYNVAPGQQTQNMSKTQQDTLTKFPRFAHGPKDAISGSVTCLLGKDMFPFDFTNQRYDYVLSPHGTDIYGDPTDYRWEWEKGISPHWRNGGGYKEQLDDRFPDEYRTSNHRIDMLNAWRKVCQSGNPKLLKDPAGQTMLIQITSNSNTSNESWNEMAQEISFDWMQIGDTKYIKIIGEV